MTMAREGRFCLGPVLRVRHRPVGFLRLDAGADRSASELADVDALKLVFFTAGRL